MNLIKDKISVLGLDIVERRSSFYEFCRGILYSYNGRMPLWLEKLMGSHLQDKCVTDGSGSSLNVFAIFEIGAVWIKVAVFDTK